METVSGVAREDQAEVDHDRCLSANASTDELENAAG